MWHVRCAFAALVIINIPLLIPEIFTSFCGPRRHFSPYTAREFIFIQNAHWFEFETPALYLWLNFKKQLRKQKLVPEFHLKRSKQIKSKMYFCLSIAFAAVKQWTFLFYVNN